MMDKESKKLLTNKIGEIWHEYTIGYKTGKLSECSCGQTGLIVLDSCSKKKS